MIRIRFGMTSAREVELEVEESEDVAAAFDLAMAEGAKVLWVADTRGHRHGIVLDKVAFVEVEPTRPREVGFGPS
ncbi:MAG TPA: DUF3107 family protein [Actinobacteria bacterium]|nr:DUF3107 family protein [Actinomycetota bacterium]